MPWRCPVCQTEVRHSALDEQPRVGLYRCHVCRLELTFDRDTERMTVAPLEIDHSIEPPPPVRARTIPTPLTVRKKVRAAKPKRRKPAAAKVIRKKKPSHK